MRRSAKVRNASFDFNQRLAVFALSFGMGFLAVLATTMWLRYRFAPHFWSWDLIIWLYHSIVIGVFCGGILSWAVLAILNRWQDRAG